MAGSAMEAIACRVARCPRRAVRPRLVSVTCRRDREFARTRETITYPASASAERCLLRTESEISRLSERQRTSTTARARASRKSVVATARGSTRQTLPRSRLPRSRAAMTIGGVGGEQTRRDGNSHRPAKSPDHNCRIAWLTSRSGPIRRQPLEARALCRPVRTRCAVCGARCAGGGSRVRVCPARRRRCPARGGQRARQCVRGLRPRLGLEEPIMSCQCSRSGTIHPAVGRLSIETDGPGDSRSKRHS